MRNEDRKVGGQACQAECRLINKLKLHAIIFAASRTAKVAGRKDLILELIIIGRQDHHCIVFSTELCLLSYQIKKREYFLP
jgi:hypothetical protein